MKFLKQIFGPIHLQTRFLPLLKHNKETLHHTTFLVDHIELYEDYKTQADIVWIEDLRKDHPWSKDKEIIWKELDVEKHIRNFRKFYMEQYPLPVNILRFGVKHLLDNNVTNITFVGNNVYMTNKNELIENYFKSIPPGSFHFAPQGGKNNLRPSPISSLKEKLEQKFPNLKFPIMSLDAELYFYNMNFRNKEEGLLFVEIWDYIVYELNIDNTWLFSCRSRGYTMIDDIMGYMAEIFRLNFDYEIYEYLQFWHHSVLGFHMTSPHDSIAYGSGLTIRSPDGQNIWEMPNSSDDLEIKSISDYIKKYKEALMWFYTNHAVHCYVQLDEEKNEITITHKNL